ncbi:MAG: hypothetical protein M1837_000373 [Sclerophora amabilis]|nr:MAG: hypothetical protein M1837_000373 [Sclerophora amabilis]
MAATKRATDRSSRAPFTPDAYDSSLLPDFDRDFVSDADIAEFAKALSAPESSADEVSSAQPSNLFITALNDWRPVHQRVRRKGAGAGAGARKGRPPRRGKDETREGFVYTLLKWPLLVLVMVWIIALGAIYLITRWYIWSYEHFFTWRGKRQSLRRRLQSTVNYEDWVTEAEALDKYLGNDAWKENDEYAYYDHATVAKVQRQMRQTRLKVEAEERAEKNGSGGQRPVDELRSLVEATVKNNFVGIENPRLYSQTYCGTKVLVQEFVDEVTNSLSLLIRTTQLSRDEKRSLFRHVETNFGRTTLCLSGGASFAYYHFGVVRALLDAKLLPEVITGTSGGALVAALVATRKDEELKKLLVPALAGRINACRDDFRTWARRWYRTGARFDSLDWARRCGWFTRGSLTFREAYRRTGRVLNVTCVPSDPHSPTILANHLTCPDCVIWSAVLASAAVPGILNPVVLMMKTKDGRLAPYSFGHKWKDGSLRTDIPLKALNRHFNVNFSIVSQVNPHINLFFFSSRGSVGRPVTHRRGRGWRGGFLGSAVEQYIKLDLNKWLKVLRHLELLPRPLGQDWSEIWLQRFSGTITIWPKTLPSDFYYILSDPTPTRLARMLHVGQQSTFPNIKFIANRMKIERLVEQGRLANRAQEAPTALTPNDSKSTTAFRTILSEEDLQGMLREVRRTGTPVVAPPPFSLPPAQERPPPPAQKNRSTPISPSFSNRLSGWWNNLQSRTPPADVDGTQQQQQQQHHPLDSTSTGRPSPMAASPVAGGARSPDNHREDVSLPRRPRPRRPSRSGSVISEIGRQSQVFFDDSEVDDTEGSAVEDTDQYYSGGDTDPDGTADDGDDDGDGADAGDNDWTVGGALTTDHQR